MSTKPRTLIREFDAVQFNIPKGARRVGAEKPEGADFEIPAHLHWPIRAKDNDLPDGRPFLVNVQYYGASKPGTKEVVCRLEVWEKETETYGLVRYIDLHDTEGEPTNRVSNVPIKIADDDIEVVSGCYLHVAPPRLKEQYDYTCACGATGTQLHPHDEDRNGPWQCKACRAPKTAAQQRLIAAALAPKDEPAPRVFETRTPRHPHQKKNGKLKKGMKMAYNCSECGQNFEVPFKHDDTRFGPFVCHSCKELPIVKLKYKHQYNVTL